MKPKRQLVRILMARDDLRNIPVHRLPVNYSVRWYRPGDEEHWLRIQSLADEDHEINLALFRKYFGSDEKTLSQRQCFMFAPDGKPIGTATAWFDDNFEG